MATYFDPIKGGLVSVPESVTNNADNFNVDDVQYFHQTTKPTTRPNGSALVVGDRWWKTDDGTEWFWNGTYWLGERFTVGNIIAVQDMFYRVGRQSDGLFLHYIEAVGRVATDPPNWDESNYWRCNLGYGNGGGTLTLGILNSTDGYVGGPDQRFYKKFNYNIPVAVTPSVNGGGLNIFSQIRSVGSPTGSSSGFGSALCYFFTVSFIAN